jgi:membrane protease YdiL (CAAX protease family)
VFFPSLVFGLFKDRTQRLLAPILLHVFYNAGYFWLFAAP